MRTAFRSRRGTALMTALVMMLIMATLTTLMVNVSFTDAQTSTTLADRRLALELAEAGLGYGRAQLGRQLQIPGHDGIAELLVGQTSQWMELPAGTTSGTYRVNLEQVAGQADCYRIRAQGRYEGSFAEVETGVLFTPPTHVPPVPITPPPLPDMTGDMGAMTLVVGNTTQVDSAAIRVNVASNPAWLDGNNWNETGTAKTGSGNAPALAHTRGGSLGWDLTGKSGHVISGYNSALAATTTSAPGAFLSSTLNTIADTARTQAAAGSPDITVMSPTTYSTGTMGGSSVNDYKVAYAALKPGEQLQFAGQYSAYGILVIDAPNGITGEVLAYSGNPQFNGLIIIRTPAILNNKEDLVSLTGTGKNPNSVLGGIAVLVSDQLDLGKGSLVSVGGNGNLRFSSATIGKAIDAFENVRDPIVPEDSKDPDPAGWDRLYFLVRFAPTFD
jgi:hypothetical protein